MAKNFKQGDIVKSSIRTVGYPLFLMVLIDINTDQFNGVILYDASYDEDMYDTVPGYTNDSWNVDSFELSNWSEIKEHI